MLFGAGGVTRTHDLLITKCIGVLRLTVFRDFGVFPLGILREVRPILSTVFVRSFSRVGHGVGQAVDPHFDSHHFQHFCNEKAPKAEVFDAFWSWWCDSNT